MTIYQHLLHNSRDLDIEAASLEPMDLTGNTTLVTGDGSGIVRGALLPVVLERPHAAIVTVTSGTP